MLVYTRLSDAYFIMQIFGLNSKISVEGNLAVLRACMRWPTLHRYLDITESHKVIIKQLSWDNDFAAGRSAGGLRTVNVGNVMEHCSIISSPVAFSNSEAEHNESCLAVWQWHM
jgi:hypothetical protein